MQDASEELSENSVPNGSAPHESVPQDSTPEEWVTNESAPEQAVELDVTVEEFDELVAAALDGIPDELATLVRNVVLLVEDDPPPDDPHLLGYYDGWALTERPANHAGALPDRILLFRNPLVEMCADRAELVDEIRITVVHEIAHHFGIDDSRLHELGYG